MALPIVGEKVRREGTGLQRVQLPPANWFAPSPGTGGLFSTRSSPPRTEVTWVQRFRAATIPQANDAFASTAFPMTNLPEKPDPRLSSAILRKRILAALALLLMGLMLTIPSVVTSKPANGGRGKTGQRKRLGTRLFYAAGSCGSKSVFVRQLLGPHLST